MEFIVFDAEYLEWLEEHCPEALDYLFMES